MKHFQDISGYLTNQMAQVLSISNENYNKDIGDEEESLKAKAITKTLLYEKEVLKEEVAET